MSNSHVNQELDPLQYLNFDPHHNHQLGSTTHPNFAQRQTDLLYPQLGYEVGASQPPRSNVPPGQVDQRPYYDSALSPDTQTVLGDYQDPYSGGADYNFVLPRQYDSSVPRFADYGDFTTGWFTSGVTLPLPERSTNVPVSTPVPQDTTSAHGHPPEELSHNITATMSSAAPNSRSRKRSASAQATPSRVKKSRMDSDVEVLDLASEDDPVLEKVRQDAIKSQREDGEDGLKPFGDMNCIICMDNFTDVTSTPCGHIFCHECLTQALVTGERGDRGAGSCPVCRKQLRRTTKNHVIPLSFMTRAKFVPPARR